MAKGKNKASNPEVAERITEVLKIRLDGAAFHDCIEYAKEKGWDVSERQVGRYIEAADNLLLERQDRKRKRVIARRLSQREALFARAVNAADYRTALAIVADMDKLQGHYTSDRDIRDILKLAAVQEERIRELEKRLADATRPTGQTPAAGSQAGPVGDCGTGEARGPAGGVPVGPGEAHA